MDLASLHDVALASLHDVTLASLHDVTLASLHDVTHASLHDVTIAVGKQTSLELIQCYKIAFGDHIQRKEILLTYTLSCNNQMTVSD